MKTKLKLTFALLMWAIVSCVQEVQLPKSKRDYTFTRNSIINNIEMIGFESEFDKPSYGMLNVDTLVDGQPIYMKDTISYYDLHTLKAFYVGCDTFLGGRLYYAEPIALDSATYILIELYLDDIEPLKNVFRVKIHN